MTLCAEIGRQLAVPRARSEVLATVTALAVDRVPGTERASVTEGYRGHFATVASTDETARALDGIQHALGAGPCVDAIRQNGTVRTGDLLHDGRWPTFGRRAAGTHGVASMLSFRLPLEHDDDRIAGLNLYSSTADAFSDDSETIGTLIASHGGLAIAAAAARDRATGLEAALGTCREIGVAMGILMATDKLTRDEAFDLLRIASQKTNRKLADLAADVADTGTLDLPGRCPGGGGPADRRD